MVTLSPPHTPCLCRAVCDSRRSLESNLNLCHSLGHSLFVGQVDICASKLSFGGACDVACS